MKKHIQLLILILSINNMHLFAQASIQWQKNYGGTEADFAYSITKTNDGGYITAGTTSSNNNDVTLNHGGQDCWVVKINSIGTIKWQKSYGGSGDDIAYKIKQTFDGGYIVAGKTGSADGDVTSNKGGEDFWVIKLDTAGTISWQKTFGGSGNDNALTIIQTADSGYAVAGLTLSNDSDVTSNHGVADFWIVKTDTSGTIQWQKTFGGSDFDYATSIVQSADGNYYVGGGSSSNNGNVSGNHANNDMWIIKIDATANLIWQKCYGSNQFDECDDMLLTNDGNIILAGVASANNGDVTGNHGGTDQWIVKADTAGTILWEKSYGGSSDDLLNSIIEKTNGGFAAIGVTGSINGNVTGNHGGNDAWFTSLDSLGNLRLQKCFGGTLDDAGNTLLQTTDGGFIVCGTAKSSDGDLTANFGIEDDWIFKLSSLTNISENNSSAYNVDVYPNPVVNNQITINFSSGIDQKFTITITDLAGKIVSEKFINAESGRNIFTLRVNDNISPGTYLLYIINEKESSHTKIVVN